MSLFSRRTAFFDIHEADPCGLQLVRIGIDLYFPLGSPDDFGTGDLAQFFKAVLHLVGIILEAYAVVIAAHIHKHDGQFAEGEFLHIGFLGKIGGKVGLGLVDGVFHLLLGQLRFHIGIELHHNQAVIGLRSALYFLDLGTADALELFFDGAGHQVFDVAWGIAHIYGDHADGRHYDVGKLFLGKRVEFVEPVQRNQQRDDVDGGAVVDRPAGRTELLEFFL